MIISGLKLVLVTSLCAWAIFVKRERSLQKPHRSFKRIKKRSGLYSHWKEWQELFVAIGNLKNAARLIGWADATRKEINDTRPLLEQRDVDKVIAACISRMGEVAFADAYDEGQVMTLDEAVALALNESKPYQ